MPVDFWLRTLAPWGGMPVRCAVTAWGHADDTFEQARHMRLIGETQLLRHLRADVADCEALLGGADPALQMVRVRRHAHGSCEFACQEKAVDLCGCGEL